MLLKFSILKDLSDRHIFITGIPLKLNDFEIVDTSLQRSDRLVSKVFDNLYFYVFDLLTYDQFRWDHLTENMLIL